MEDKIKTFHCGVDVTYNTWVHVEASSEEEAEKKAIHQVNENHASSTGSFAFADVHCIHEED